MTKCLPVGPGPLKQAQMTSFLPPCLTVFHLYFDLLFLLLLSVAWDVAAKHFRFGLVHLTDSTLVVCNYPYLFSPFLIIFHELLHLMHI